ncbi:F0F1 ATP synthase subunit A [Calderihabitans maritimus]|uniref:ATP synthase subunit a n=1 Tax=Calderihabitans maritimus TaxID=1246530 RepID=A0A1Z5HWX0_9FIRM|nr:F0F1 ATP synthase subunit A [Calderihabitans maritimus]GAW93831.1 ATP synthase F0 subunit A [Calderihabitans maritimus]
MEHGGGHEVPGALFHLFGLEVTSRVTTMWAIMLLIIVFSWLATRNLRRVPTGAQNVMEMITEALLDFFAGIMGYRRAKQYLPLLMTLFIFILISNYSGLLPMAGKIPGLAAPTSAWGVTLGLAIVVFFATQISGFKTHGLGYLKHFIQPVAFMLPLVVIEQFVRPLSLSLRLFGNIFGEEMTIEQLFELVHAFVPLPMMFLSLLMGLIQAVVFTLLTAVYIAEATEEHAEHH